MYPIRQLRLAVLMLAAVAQCGCHDSPATPGSTVDVRGPSAWQWRYDPAAPYFDYLPVAVQERRSGDAREMADAACRSLAGRLELISPLKGASPAYREFTCRMSEAGRAFSMDFGAVIRESRHADL